MKEQVVKLIRESVSSQFPALNLKKYIRWAIFAFVSFFMVCVLIVALLVFLIIRLVTGGVNYVSEVSQEDRSVKNENLIEERLIEDKNSIEQLQKRIEELEKMVPKL